MIDHILSKPCQQRYDAEVSGSPEEALGTPERNWRMLTNLSLHGDHAIATQAAKALEQAVVENLIQDKDAIAYLINCVTELKHVTCQKHYSKILAHLTSNRAQPAIQIILFDVDMEKVTEQCFKWLITPDVLVTIKIYACEILFNLRGRYPWVAEDLPEQLSCLMGTGSVALFKKCKKLLRLMEATKRIKLKRQSQHPGIIKAYNCQ